MVRTDAFCSSPQRGGVPWSGGGGGPGGGGGTQVGGGTVRVTPTSTLLNIVDLVDHNFSFEGIQIKDPE